MPSVGPCKHRFSERRMIDAETGIIVGARLDGVSLTKTIKLQDVQLTCYQTL